MNGNYQWIDLDGKRVFRVTDLSTTPNKSVDVPLDVGLARVKMGHQGARSRDELLVAKVVCDKNDVELIKKWLTGPATPNVIAEYEEAMAAQKKMIADLEAKLAAASKK